MTRSTVNEARIQVSIQGNAISLAGELTHDTVNAVYADTPAFTETDYRIDLQGVKKADSAALALFVDWYGRATENSAHIHFSHIPDKLREIAQLANLEKIFD